MTGQVPQQDLAVRIRAERPVVSSAWARTLWILTLALCAVYGALIYLDRSQPVDLYGYVGATPVDCLIFATLGAVVAARHRRNPMGWLFIAVAIILLVNSDVQLYAIHALRVAPGSLPFGRIAGWLSSWLWVPGVALVAIFVPLLFPDGRPPGRKWRVWSRIAGVTVVVQVAAVAIASLPGADATLNASGQFSAVGTPGTTSFLILAVSDGSIIPLGLISVLSLLSRRHHADPEVRQQLKFFLYASVILLVGVIASGVGNIGGGGRGQIYDIGAAILVTSVAAIPVGAGLAILRYRLYDIDVVISRTVVYGSLAVIITAVYVGVAVGIGSLVGGGGQPNLGLSIVATAIVAVGFQPLRERLQRLANRLVYGKRATPYEVLSAFSEHVAQSYTGNGVLQRMARVLAEGTGAEHATVWRRQGNSLSPTATHPPGAASYKAMSMPDGTLPPIPGATRTVAIRHQGDVLGALSVVARRGETLTPLEATLLDDLAVQAGLVLRNVGLTIDLQARLEDLRISRQRLVSAQDAERRRLERDLHDGAQQHLVAIKVKLGLAERLIRGDTSKAHAMLEDLQTAADEALTTVRDLAHGIYPPLLAERGLAAALESQAGKVSLPVVLDAAGVGRYSQEVETTVYFCILEALQNVQKYAQASVVHVRLRLAAPELQFDVEDDGRGFDVAGTARGAGLTNIEDRLDALGGSLEIRTVVGSGTTVRGRIPLSTKIADQVGEPAISTSVLAGRVAVDADVRQTG